VHKIDTDGNVAGAFTDGDPLIPTPATVIDAPWLNAVQGELVNAIEGLGGTLVKGTNNQILARLNARYGRLDLANTWAAAQTFGSTVAVTGNVSLGGSLAVTGSTTLTGPTTANGATRVNAMLGLNIAPVFPLDHRLGPTAGDAYARVGASRPLMLRAGTGAPGLGFNLYADGTQNVRADQGYGAEMLMFTDGSLRVSTADTGAVGSAATLLEKVRVGSGAAATANTPATALTVLNGYVALSAVNPNSNVAFLNTITPQHILKAHGKCVTNGSGGGSVSGGTGISSVTASGGSVTVTFAQAFANADYDATVTMHASVYSVATITAQTATSLTFQAVDLTIGSGGAMTGIAVLFASNVRTFSVMAAGAQ
jgi:hypothetical protein